MHQNWNRRKSAAGRFLREHQPRPGRSQQSSAAPRRSVARQRLRRGQQPLHRAEPGSAAASDGGTRVMKANQIIRRPLVTEKSTLMRETGANVIAFEVDPHANKIEVKDAVEELFKVKVAEVRLFNVKGKVKRMGRYAGKRRDWRKAYVRLKEGEKAPDFIEGV